MTEKKTHYELDVRVVRVDRTFKKETEYNSETRQNDVKMIPMGDRVETELVHHTQKGNRLDGTIETVKAVLDLLKDSKYVDAD